MLGLPPKCAERLVEVRQVPCHNLPCSVLPDPDIREAAFPAKWLAVFVLACSRHVTSRNRKVLAVNSNLEGGISRTGVGVVIIKIEEGSFIVNGTVWHDVAKVVCPNPFKMVRIFGERYLAPWNGKLSELFSDLFCFVSRYR